MRKISLILLIIVLLLVSSGLAARYFLAHESPAAKSGVSSQALFAARLVDANGQLQDLSQWRGKTLVVNFWATWCPPCREEMPELSALQKNYRDRNVIVLGLAPESQDKIQQFSQQAPVSYPLFAGDIDVINIGNSLGNDRGVLPYTVIIRTDGSIAKMHFGRIDQALLAKTLDPLLQ